MDALNHFELTSEKTLSETGELARIIDHHFRGERPEPVLLALTVYMKTVCEYLDMDPTAAFEQIMELLTDGHVEVETVSPRLSAN